MMKQGSSRRSLVLLISTAVSLYFGYHAYAGQYGLEARWRLTSELESAEARLRDLEALHGTLDRDIELLQSERLDPDMLDETARRLGFVHPDDVVVLQR